MDNPIAEKLEEFEQLYKELSKELTVLGAQVNLSRQVVFARLPKITALFQRIQKVSEELHLVEDDGPGADDSEMNRDGGYGAR